MPGGRLHGFLVIDKPASWTSHDVIAWTRRLIGERQIGHAGTLDPAATGVLPLGVGYATRLMENLAEADKSYVATIRFGIETDSYDGDGRLVSVHAGREVTLPDVEGALSGWLGPKMQEPPMHSAIRIGGQRLYELAHRGEVIERPSRPVTFHRLELLAWHWPDAVVLIECSKGTYVRSFAHDLGKDLGTGAYLANLVRSRSGPFCLADAWTLAELKERWELEGARCWAEIAQHPDAAVSTWPALLLDNDATTQWRNGQTIQDSPDVDGPCRAYSAGGDWLGIGARAPADGGWRPTKVDGGSG